MIEGNQSNEFGADTRGCNSGSPTANPDSEAISRLSFQDENRPTESVKSAPLFPSETLVDEEPNNRDARDMVSGETPERAFLGALPIETSACPVLPGDWRIKEARRRQELLQAFWALLEQGFSRTKAAKKLGCAYVNLWRYEKAFKTRGFDGLIPNMEECGRKSDFDLILKDEKFCAKLLEIYLSTVGASGNNVVRGRRTAKMATALTAMAEEAECPPALASRLKRGRFPVCLVRFLKRVTPEMENRQRGAKHFQLNGITSRRDLTLRFPNGDRAEMPAGFKWVFDDMSVNQPFWCEADGKILFSRQGLYAIDHRSLKWLGKMLVARPREAYRAEDILRFLRGLFLAYGGKPDVIVFEQGIWKARKIHGFKLNEFGQPVEDVFERGEMVDGEKHLLTDGLAAIGIKVIFATSAHGKIIETCFNPLQTQIAIRTREFVNIGRYAGEFEIPGKRLAQVRYAQSKNNLTAALPNFLGFAPQNILDERIDEAIQFINFKQNSRGEIPEEIWAADIAKRPLLENQRNDAAVFLPEIRERVIDGGRVTVKVNGQSHDFRAPWMIELGSGYKVFCRFDPAEPSRGAAIYNRETGSNNFSGYKPGQFLGFVSWEMPAPSVDVTGDVRGITPQSATDFYGEGAFDNGDSIRKKQNKIVSTSFSAFVNRPGQPRVVRMREIRDGEGRVSRVSISGAANEAEKTDMPALAPVAAAPVPMRRNILAAPSPDEFAKKRERLAASAAAARNLQNLVET
ncbi:MAG TPA: helix-turn-helix domain-containing protein [Verrucomicrobiae bacterium]|nr:helix-turn-helix domain-containing protein [Verrucomicrobiae bacterium]